jgi:hypothetical protein
MPQQRFRVEFRKQQLFKHQDETKPVTIKCNPDCSATYVDGLIPDNDWQDVTAFTEGLDNMTFTWSAFTSDYSRGSDNVSGSAFGSNYSKALSAELGFMGVAFDFIYNWLMLNNCQVLNAVEVKLTDVVCQKAYRIFEIKADNLEYSPITAPCYLKVALREQDLVYHSFQKTIIEDDWQKWFNSDGTSGKVHPAVIYIVEKKPPFIVDILLTLAYLVGICSIGLSTLTGFFKRWIRKIFGAAFYCPAPYIHTYIENICQKYGYTFDTMFDDLSDNQFRNLVLFFPVTKYYTNFEDESFDSPSAFYLWDNRTAYAFSDFLDQLKKLFNAEWYVTPNKELVFKSKEYFQNLPPIADFTLPSLPFRIYELKYTFNGDKKPAYGDYKYQIDPQDLCSNDLKWRYNTIVAFDEGTDNPMLEGNRTLDFDFACTSFVQDGATKDWVQGAVEVSSLIAVGVVLVGLIAMAPILNVFTATIIIAAVTAAYFITRGYIKKIADKSEISGAVRTSSAVINIPRLLLMDMGSSDSQKKTMSVVDPPIVPYYNHDPTVNYYQEHPAFDADAGYFGSEVVKIYNYPMYFDEKFGGNLYGKYHEIDNSLKTPESNQTFEAEMDLCCETLDLFGVWENTYTKIGAVVIIEKRGDVYIRGRLNNLKVDYSKGKVNIMGVVLSCGGRSAILPPSCEGSAPELLTIMRDADNSVVIYGDAPIGCVIIIYIDGIKLSLQSTTGELQNGLVLHPDTVAGHTSIMVYAYRGICQFGYSNALGIPADLIWIGIDCHCLVDEDEVNTGYFGCDTLQQVASDTLEPTGLEKPNVISSPDYIAPELSDAC